MAAEWHLYLVRTREGSLYTGIARDVTRRLGEHQQAGDRGSKYLRSRGPLEVVYQAPIGDRSLASRAEHCVKRLSREQKEAIVNENPPGGRLLARLGLQGEPAT